MDENNTSTALKDGGVQSAAIATADARYPAKHNQPCWYKHIPKKYGENPCTGLGCGTPTNFETPKSQVWPWQQLLPDSTPQNLISSRSSQGKHILKIW